MNSSEEQGRPAEPPVTGTGILGSAISRAAGFFAFWLALTDANSGDLAAGLAAAVAATWASLRLMPAEQWNLNPVKLARFTLHFLRQSIVAGTDVALRALDPRLSLRPGYVVYQAQLPPGTKRNAFCAVMSLLPGTLPCGSAEGNGLTIHCLDVAAPVVEQLAAEEALFLRTFGGAQRND
ncbi:Na+/H+ antiporter subunit E [Bradyrhizobium liaoningense]|uniref:Na+/H+ antiporter subunit E n=1 Tax=Bradyrhizobium liaoningense TaxID=43992 RepID=UPI001BA9B0FB|nr:Na+/H+ antiporter subunit E [Bradyrhizobium liaoningense]MBR0819863.1 Na+/H+ antiporter subunit E [Bradyrhizobium liaoningense]